MGQLNAMTLHAEGHGEARLWILRTIDGKQAVSNFLFDGRWKLIHFEGGLRPMLFDLENDPEEFEDLGASAGHRQVIDQMYGHLNRWGTSADELYRVWPKGSYPLTVEQLEAIAQQRTALTVALLDEQVIGFANLYQYEAKYSAFIGNVIIDQKQRNLGLGKQLIRHMI